MTITKKDFIAKLSESAEISKTDAEKCLNSVINVITTELAAGNKITITGFGTFSVTDTPERTAINPRTKETVIVAAKKSPKFKAGKTLKDAVQ